MLNYRENINPIAAAVNCFA